MNSGLLRGLGKIAGLAGISVGAFLLIFQSVLKQKILPQTGLTSSQGYHVILALMVLTFGIAAVGVISWIVGLGRGPQKPVTLPAVIILALLVLFVLLVAGAVGADITPFFANKAKGIPSAREIAQANASLQEEQASKSLPHLSAHILLGSIVKGQLLPRVVVENIGIVATYGLACLISADGTFGLDGVPSETEIAPHGKIEIPFPSVFKPTLSAASVLLVYRTSAAASAEIYHSHFNFLMPLRPSTTTEIYPSSIEEGADDGGYQRNAAAAIISRLRGRIGTIMIAVPDKNPDGTPNKFIYTVKNKTIFVNPVSHKIALRCVFPRGIVLSELTLKPNDTGIHTVAIAWNDDNQNAELYGDGEPAKSLKSHRGGEGR